ncbi:MAG: homoserine dehydrogenase [Pirellulales bacterium]|nr:homoserine dehydrogenase [Pirellulales bacterium]
MQKIKVAIVGFGLIGSGVARLLLEHKDRLARHAGRILWLEKAVDPDLTRSRNVDLPRGILTDDLTEVTQNPEIKVVAQLIGGLEPARTVMLALLESGKDVVTANKALLAEHGPELFDRARELGRSIAFEASVAGGVPIINAIGQCLSGNQIESLHGILNGTSNFILTQMEERGATFEDAVRDAQHRGYAEADPTLDVDGTDAAQKLAILAQLGFGARVAWTDIPRRGINSLDVADVHFARELGYRIKQLAIARLTGDGLELHVSPTLVKMGMPLAEVREAYNAISVIGDAVGRVFFHGLGAGQMPTASAVVADMIDTAVGRTAITFRTLELWSRRKARVNVGNYANASGRFYMRFNVKDHPGVMSQVAGVLGKHTISIASVLQHEAGGEGEEIPLLIMTHRTTEGAASRACQEIEAFEFVHAPSVRMWVRD